MAHQTVSISQQSRATLFVQVRGPVELGRECDGIVLRDERVSRRHVRLEPSRGGILVTDLGSTNGTFLDGQEVTAPVILSPGAELRIGSTTVRCESDAAASAPVLPAPTPPTVVTGPGHTSIDAVLASIDEGVPLPEPVDDLGTVTIVFSDIEASSEKAVELGDAAWMAVLDHHNQVVTRAVAHFGGTVVKNQGDGFMLTFPGARRAIQAMAFVQRRLDEAEQGTPALRIRVGIHTGEVIDQDGDIFGKHVIYAARVANLACGGEILVSSVVHEIAAARGDLVFGEHRAVAIKGIEGDHVVYPVDWAGMP